MTPASPPGAPTDNLTRRQALAGIAAAWASLAAGPRARADSAGALAQAPEPPDALKLTSIHQEVDFKAGPPRLYEALLDSGQFAAFTGLPATIDRREGGSFSLFGGLIVGRNIELLPGERIVQAWRPADWKPGIYSIARFELKPTVSGTTILFDHEGFPEGSYASLLSGWNEHYWGPLARYLV